MASNETIYCLHVAVLQRTTVDVENTTVELAMIEVAISNEDKSSDCTSDLNVYNCGCRKYASTCFIVQLEYTQYALAASQPRTVTT